MSNEHPLFPELPEAGRQEAQALIDRFKEAMHEAMHRAAEDVLRDLYCDVTVHIESDSWTNFREIIINGICNYRNAVKFPYDFERIRRAIYSEYREEIIKDLDQDNLKRITELEREVAMLRERWNR